MTRSPVKQDFRPKARHLRDWAHDQADMARDFFGRQAPLFAIAKSVEEDRSLAKAVHRALSREFHGHVKFTNEIPRSWRCVALSVKAERSSCSECGEAAKQLKTKFVFLDHGKVVPTGELHATPAVCPACGHVEEPADSSVVAPDELLTLEGPVSTDRSMPTLSREAKHA